MAFNIMTFGIGIEIEALKRIVPVLNRLKTTAMSQGSYAAKCANSKPTHITPVSYSKGVHVSNVFMLSHLFFIVVLSDECRYAGCRGTMTTQFC
jgi:hypothetical protein